MRSFIVTGDKTQRDNYIKTFIDKESIPHHSIIEYSEEIKIKEAKNIRLSLSKKYSGKRLLIISSKINALSQNTLLKTFEELPDNVAVIISADNTNEILDTIKSRFFLVSINQKSEEGEVVSGLVEKSYANRFKAVDKFINDNASQDPKILVDEFLLKYRKELLHSYDNMGKNVMKNHLSIIKDLIKISNLVKSNNLNLRLALENVVLK